MIIIYNRLKIVIIGIRFNDQFLSEKKKLLENKALLNLLKAAAERLAE